MIICSNQDEEKCHIISKLYPFRRSYDVSFDLTKCKQYLRNHFISANKPIDEVCKRDGLCFASAVDQEKYEFCLHFLHKEKIYLITNCFYCM